MTTQGLANGVPGRRVPEHDIRIAATGSEKATFEIIMAAAVGAGLSRWQQAMKVLDEATNAPA